MLFTMEKTPVLPFEQMNFVHHEELDLANSIFRFLNSSSLQGEERKLILDKMLKEFLIHVKEHFQYEEELMTDTNCPILGCHRDEHNRVLKLMIEVFRDFYFSRDEEMLKAYFDYEFKNWILDHIVSMDMVTATYFDKYEKGEELPQGACSSHSHSDHCAH